MKFKISILAALAAIAFPVAAQAQDTNGYDSLKVSCESGAECSDFGVNFQEQGDTVAQTRRTRTRRTRSSSDSKIYLGGTLGLFFPSDVEDTVIDPGTGLGGSVYGGYKFTDLISADAEALLAFGGNDIDDVTSTAAGIPATEEIDGAYTLFSVFLNPRFTYTFDKGNDKSPYVFASPGVGIGRINIRGDVGDEIDDADGDSSGSGFALQGKIGGGYPFTDKLDVIGQARYANIFNVVERPQLGGNTEDEGISYFGIELGLNYKL